MELQNFSIEQINNYTMWFMLDKIKNGPITMLHRTPAGDKPFNNFACFKMNNGNILLGFNHFLSFPSKDNLIAVSESIEEIVNVQYFENIVHFYNKDIDDLTGGYFIFANSDFVPSKFHWRCDKEKFGPINFSVKENNEKVYAENLEELIEFDVIMSVNNVGHIVYLQTTFDADNRKVNFQSSNIPDTCLTISELFKTIVEWSIVNESPFNNKQEISHKAKKFLSALNFDISLTDYQADMYIAEFIKGNTNARKRPSNVQPLSAELDLFIKKRMSYRCLSALISLYPDAWNLQEIIYNEKEALDNIHNSILDVGLIKNGSIQYTIFNNIKNRTESLHNTVKSTGTF